MQNRKKQTLIGSFVKKNKILSFLEMVRNEFKIPFPKIFVFLIGENKNEYLVTFKVFEKDNCLSYLNNSTVLHVKNGCIFSINALNKLIDVLKEEKHIENEDFIINFEEYNGKLIISSGNGYKIENLTLIEDKCILLL